MIVERTDAATLLAPASVHWEVGNAFSAMVARDRLTLRQAGEALAAYQRIPIRFIDLELPPAVSLATELDLYAYDAYLIACARKQRCPLLTLDTGLMEAAERAGVEVVRVAS